MRYALASRKKQVALGIIPRPCARSRYASRCHGHLADKGSSRGPRSPVLAGRGSTREPAVDRAIGIAAVTLLATAGLATRIARTGDSAGTLVAGRVTHLTREPGLEIDPALSPDGRAIAYAAGVPGDMRIYVRQIDGGRAIAVAELLVDNQRVPRWSPDGTRLIFQVGHAERENAPGVSPNALYVVPAFGGVPRRLVVDSAGSDLSPAWSPDGARIAFVRGQGVYGQHIFVVDADGASAPTRLADAKEATGLRWSPGIDARLRVWRPALHARHLAPRQ